MSGKIKLVPTLDKLMLTYRDLQAIIHGIVTKTYDIKLNCCIHIQLSIRLEYVLSLQVQILA